MIRLSSLVASAAASVLLLGATAASAQPAGGFYAAKPAAAANVARLVVRDTLWTCGEVGCSSNSKGGSRAAIVCESLAREVGTLESFRAGDVMFDAAALAKCNAKA
jgi:hypothetical protein